jgi:ABC-type bacteriocin/lantibiotic exporter with double-glycine peptidase domain
MDLKDIQTVAQSDVVFAVLFIGLLWISAIFINRLMQDQRETEKQREEQLIELYREQKAESAEREKELMQHLDRITERQAEITNTLREVKEDMRGGLTKLEEKVDRGFVEVWRAINQNRGDN